MDNREFETVIKCMAEKIQMLEWELKNERERNGKLAAEVLSLQTKEGNENA